MTAFSMYDAKALIAVSAPKFYKYKKNSFPIEICIY